jgi:transcriptional regulator with XRE-family HTH domain
MVSVRDLGEYIREQRKGAQISLRQLARQAGVSNPYLSQIERGLRKPSAEILQQIAKALRISAEALYVQAGILDEREPGSVATVVLGDTTITERQKQVLIEIYESFRRENGEPDPALGADAPTPAATGGPVADASAPAAPSKAAKAVKAAPRKAAKAVKAAGAAGTAAVKAAKAATPVKAAAPEAPEAPEAPQDDAPVEIPAAEPTA